MLVFVFVVCKLILMSFIFEILTYLLICVIIYTDMKKNSLVLRYKINIFLFNVFLFTNPTMYGVIKYPFKIMDS